MTREQINGWLARRADAPRQPRIYDIFDLAREAGVVFLARNGGGFGYVGRPPSGELAGLIRGHHGDVAKAIALVGRLETGEMKIERDVRAGNDIAKLDAHWEKLLHEYEQVMSGEAYGWATSSGD